MRVRIGTWHDFANTDIGASIASAGVCLTVVALGQTPRNWFDVEISAETVSKTNLQSWTLGKRLNLERALKVGDELGGHIVSDHVDGVTQVVRVAPQGDAVRATIRAPQYPQRDTGFYGHLGVNQSQHLAGPRRMTPESNVYSSATTHYDAVCNDSSRAISLLGLQGVYIGNGILTVENRTLAEVRAKPQEQNKGGGAAAAALHLIALSRKWAGQTKGIGFRA